MFLARVLVGVWVFLSLSSAAWAGGVLKSNIDGVPFQWGEELVYNFEQGALKPGVYDTDASRALVEEAFQTWAKIPGVQISIQRGPDLSDGGDTNLKNFEDFYYGGTSECYDNNPSTPCINPIIFDADGKILEEMFGECAQFSILGFGGFRDVAQDSTDPALAVIKRGQAIFNGACIEPVEVNSNCGPCNTVLDEEGVKSLILHELGHMLGMDHSQVNPESYLDCNAKGGCTKETAEDIPTMFPLLVRGARMVTLHRDDIAQFQKMYGNPKADTCSVSGKVFNKAGSIEIRGVEVVVRNTDSFLSTQDSLSVISGALSPRINSTDKTQGNCLEDCGAYEITGLQPGQSYQICVQRVLSKFTGTKGIYPVESPFQDFDNDCPEGLEVTCDCQSNGSCPEFTGKDIFTTNTGLDAASSIFLPGGSGGGCSLQKPVKTQAWLSLSLPWIKRIS